MRKIHKHIVGGFIFSKDNKVLLGYSRVYANELGIPGGNIDLGEAAADALAREIKEETSLDITEARIEELPSVPHGESEAVLSTGEHVWKIMAFHDYAVYVSKNAADIPLVPADDYSGARWYSRDDLKDQQIAAPTRARLYQLGFL